MIIFSNTSVNHNINITSYGIHTTRYCKRHFLHIQTHQIGKVAVYRVDGVSGAEIRRAALAVILAGFQRHVAAVGDGVSRRSPVFRL